MNTNLATIDGSALTAAVYFWIGQALLFGTALAAATSLLTRVCRRRLRPALEAALWSMVLIKFLIPIGPPWSFSLATVCGRVPLPIGARPPMHSLDEEGVVLHAGGVRTGSTHPSSNVVADMQSWHWTTPLVGAYLVVVNALLWIRMRGYRALSVRCRILPSADEPTRRLVVDVCRRLGVRRVPKVRISDESPAPFIMGVLHPVLVLSHRQLVRPDELETVVVHEVAHLRRGDMLLRHLQWIAGVLLFFWPIVAWVNRRIDLARECACDEWALCHGHLTAGEYARCVLRAVQRVPYNPLVYHPCSMAARHTTIERRIEMILDSPRFLSRRRGLWHGVLLAAWGCFALAGGVAADSARGDTGQTRPLTEQAVAQHAVELYNFVAQRPAADFNGDGVLSYTEKHAYLVALAMLDADAFMAEFPYADRNHSKRLDSLEAFGVIHGITRIAYLDRRIAADINSVPDPDSAEGQRQIAEIKKKYEPETMALLHEALDAQQWLLDTAAVEPSAGDLDNLHSIIKRVEGPPRMFSNRMLNRGGAETMGKLRAIVSDGSTQFSELESSIAAIQADLAAATEAAEIARLKRMLDKLEAILSDLQDS